MLKKFSTFPNTFSAPLNTFEQLFLLLSELYIFRASILKTHFFCAKKAEDPKFNAHKKSGSVTEPLFIDIDVLDEVKQNTRNGNEKHNACHYSCKDF